MPQIQKVCDVFQGYDYKKDKQTTVGYVTALDVGGTTFARDQTATDPTSPGSKVAVVAVLSDVLWELGVTDAIYFTGQISTPNKQAVLGLIMESMVNIQVTFNFDVYEYDPREKRYFKVFTSAGAVMTGVLERRDDDVHITLADEPSMEVRSPENYAFSIGIKPLPTAQSLTVGIGASKSIVKPWGLSLS